MSDIYHLAILDEDRSTVENCVVIKSGLSYALERAGIEVRLGNDVGIHRAGGPHCAEVGCSPQVPE